MFEKERNRERKNSGRKQSSTNSSKMTPIINRRNLLVGLLLSITILLATACDAQSDADEQAIIDSEQNVGQVLEQSLDNPAPPSDESSELDYTDVGVGFTEDGHPYWGDPDAPIIIEEYSDYLCPF
jgi:protein-disulfide isomerase